MGGIDNGLSDKEKVLDDCDHSSNWLRAFCEGCSTQRQVKLRGPFHSEYSQRLSESHESLDGTEKMGYLKFLQVDIEP